MAPSDRTEPDQTDPLGIPPSDPGPQPDVDGTVPGAAVGGTRTQPAVGQDSGAHEPASDDDGDEPRGPGRRALVAACVVVGLGFLVGAGIALSTSGVDPAPAGTKKATSTVPTTQPTTLPPSTTRETTPTTAAPAPAPTVAPTAPPTIVIIEPPTTTTVLPEEVT